MWGKGGATQLCTMYIYIYITFFHLASSSMENGLDIWVSLGWDFTPISGVTSHYLQLVRTNKDHLCKWDNMFVCCACFLKTSKLGFFWSRLAGPLFPKTSCHWSSLENIIYLVVSISNPSEKYESIWIISPSKGENKTCLKPSPSHKPSYPTQPQPPSFLRQPVVLQP